MIKLKISNCKLDLTTNIIDFNDNFSQLFNTKQGTQLTFREVFSLSPRFLDEIEIGDTKSFIFFCNSKINNATKNNSLLLMYIAVEKNHNSYIIKITNWLNWLHNISASLETSYSLISEFNNYTQQDDFNTISDTGSSKALQTLLTYLPNKSSNNINQISLYEYNLNNTEVANIFKSDKVVNIKVKDEIYIPYTTLTRNMVAPIKHDTFLLSVINAVH